MCGSSRHGAQPLDNDSNDDDNNDSSNRNKNNRNNTVLKLHCIICMFVYVYDLGGKGTLPTGSLLTAGRGYGTHVVNLSDLFLRSWLCHMRSQWYRYGIPSFLAGDTLFVH